MNKNFKDKYLSIKIKEILLENFPKDEGGLSYSQLRDTLANNDILIYALSNAIQNDFNIDNLTSMFTTEDICSTIDAYDAVNYIGTTELLDEMDNDTIAEYLKNNNYDSVYTNIDEWSPYDHIQEAVQQLSPNTIKTAEDMKKLVCDEIDFQDTGNVFI